MRRYRTIIRDFAFAGIGSCVVVVLMWRLLGAG